MACLTKYTPSETFITESPRAGLAWRQTAPGAGLGRATKFGFEGGARFFKKMSFYDVTKKVVFLGGAKYQSCPRAP